MKFKNYIKQLEENIDQDHDIDSWKKTANMIAQHIDDEEFHFKRKYVKSDPSKISSKYASIAQKIAMTFLFSNPTVEEIMKTYKLSNMESARLLDYLNHHFYWYKDSTKWQ